MTNWRSADVLRAVADEAWPEIETLIEGAPSEVRVLGADLLRRDVALEALQVTTASFLGAIVAECGALVVDHGWLLVLGAGAAGLPGVHEANILTGGPPPVLEVAWDVLGGRFAINGGGLDAAPGEVCYWGPDTLHWTGIGGGHAAFIAWALSDALTEFYSPLRWPGWEREVAALEPDRGLSLFPPPYTAEGHEPGRVSRSAAPITELHALYADIARQVGDAPDGSQFRITITE
jgi:hypothetical protein